jgi:hypothetical protein
MLMELTNDRCQPIAAAGGQQSVASSQSPDVPLPRAKLPSPSSSSIRTAFVHIPICRTLVCLYLAGADKIDE